MATRQDHSVAGIYRGLGLAIAIGSALAIVLCLTDPAAGWSDGARWVVYMLAAGSVAGVAGLIFGLPRSRPDFSPEDSERYLANSNLEQISDWLTKLLVGAGLVELKSLPGHLAALGDYLGADLKIANPRAYALSAVVYGVGTGFGFAYLWTRLRMRILLETSDKDAAHASRKDQIVRNLWQADNANAHGQESVETLEWVADEAIANSTTTKKGPRPRILWVDDYPRNNTAIVEAMTSIGIEVDQALTTSEALDKFSDKHYALVITDLGRREYGVEVEMAGLNLIRELRAQSEVPIMVFAGPRGRDHADELRAAGATLVTDRASVAFSEGVRLATGG